MTLVCHDYEFLLVLVENMRIQAHFWTLIGTRSWIYLYTFA